MDIVFSAPHVGGQIVAMNALTALGFLWMLWGGAGEAGVAAGRRSALVGATAAGLALWYAGLIAVVQSGVLLEAGDAAVIIMVAVPSVLLSLPAFAGRLGPVVDAVPVSHLAGFHVLRVVYGYAFLALYELEGLPASFAFPAGYGDIGAGLLGALAAYLAWRRSPYAIAAVLVWTVFGLVDFVSAIATGLAMPADTPANGFLPFWLVPGFAVPFFIATHVYAIRWLVRQRGRVRPHCSKSMQDRANHA